MRPGSSVIISTSSPAPFEPTVGLDERFCEAMDAAPVMIWVSGADKGCVWFNRPWLAFTGRSMAQERGYGWTEGVHPEDVDRCLAVYASSFEARQNFRMQYRLRRHDGEFRFIDDAGHPRFAGDGTFLGFIGSCMDVTHVKALEREAQELSERLINLQEEERQRIAQELHDSTAQHLVAASLNLTVLRSSTRANDDQAKLWDEAENCLTEALREIRTLSYVMHPIGLGTDGLTSTLRRYVEGYAARSGLTIRLRSASKVDKLPLRTQLSLFRIVQEGLANVHRHARATQALVELRCTGDWLHIVITDDGQGRGRRQNGRLREGIGLHGIRARARQFGGELKFQTGVQGTLVHVLLKLSQLEAAANTDSADRGII